MNNCNYFFKKGINKGKKCNLTKSHKSYHKIIITKLKDSISIDSIKLPNSKDNIKSSNKETVLSKLSLLKQRILDLDTTLENKSVIMKHYKNLKKLDSSTSEYYKNEIFIDHALSIPWNNYYNIHNRIKDDESVKTFINNIKLEFDKYIYGMENVKNEIINYVCKFITNPNSEKNNIALYGNAGVCKTKFIKILSNILKLPVKIISLGGAKDSSYFLGHNFTYVESNYGIITQSIIDSKVMNPILYFDELDKVSLSEIGKDVYSVLSNLTDSTVNSNFTDHYFRGMSFDLSKVFYVFTFNDINKIDKVLLDRLNVIYVETPTRKEKVIILSEYCLFDIIKNIGIK
jgi:ATP-dependent Lon protease